MDFEAAPHLLICDLSIFVLHCSIPLSRGLGLHSILHALIRVYHAPENLVIILGTEPDQEVSWSGLRKPDSFPMLCASFRLMSIRSSTERTPFRFKVYIKARLEKAGMKNVPKWITSDAFDTNARTKLYKEGERLDLLPRIDRNSGDGGNRS